MKLTGQLLAFSRTQKASLQPVAIAEVLAGFRDMLDRTLGPHVQLAVNVDIPANTHVLGDHVELEMAILNLALNAGCDA